MTVETLASRICSDLISDVMRDADEQIIATSLTYPNGDHICAYLTTIEGTPSFTDFGETLDRLAASRWALTPARQDRLQMTLRAYEALQVENGITVRIDADSPGASLIRFCQVIAAVTGLGHVDTAEKHAEFVSYVDRILTARLPATAKKIHRWHDPASDPKKLWPVDWRVLHHDRPRHVFALQSPSRVAMIAATVGQLLVNNIKAPTITVIDQSVDLGPRQLERIRQVSDKLIIGGLQGKEKQLIDWLTAA